LLAVVLVIVPPIVTAPELEVNESELFVLIAALVVTDVPVIEVIPLNVIAEFTDAAAPAVAVSGPEIVFPDEK
jgi:hypothetical protein